MQPDLKKNLYSQIRGPVRNLAIRLISESPKEHKKAHKKHKKGKDRPHSPRKYFGVSATD